MSEQHGVWVYAVAVIVPTGCLTAERGVGGHPIRTVSGAGLVAAVSTVGWHEYGEDALRRNLENLPWLEATARAHHRVVSALAQHCPVVPMRLATIYHDDAGVARLLSGHRGRLGAALNRIQGHTEWGVKVYAVAEPAAEPYPANSGAGAGVAYLQHRRRQQSAAEQGRRAAAASTEAIDAALSEVATAVQIRPAPATRLDAAAGRLTLNVAYLVPDQHAERFVTVAAGLADRYRAVVVERTGPWPPYSFAGTDDDAAPPIVGAGETVSAEQAR